MTEFEQKEIIFLQHKISEALAFTCNRENYIGLKNSFSFIRFLVLNALPMRV